MREGEARLVRLRNKEEVEFKISETAREDASMCVRERVRDRQQNSKKIYQMEEKIKNFEMKIDCLTFPQRKKKLRAPKWVCRI